MDVPGRAELQSLEAVDNFVESINAAITALARSGHHPRLAAWLLRQSADAAHAGRKLTTGIVNRVASELAAGGAPRELLASSMHDAGLMNSPSTTALAKRISKAKTPRATAILSPDDDEAEMLVRGDQAAACLIRFGVAAIINDAAQDSPTTSETSPTVSD